MEQMQSGSIMAISFTSLAAPKNYWLNNICSAVLAIQTSAQQALKCSYKEARIHPLQRCFAGRGILHQNILLQWFLIAQSCAGDLPESGTEEVIWKRLKALQDTLDDCNPNIGLEYLH